MRNKTIAAAICLLLTLTLTGTALAAGSGDSGFYGIGTAPGLTVEPLTPEGDPAAGPRLCGFDHAVREILVHGVAVIGLLQSFCGVHSSHTSLSCSFRMARARWS